MSENEFTPGQTVIDREDDNPDEAVVVQCPETTIAEVTISNSGDERTVAEVDILHAVNDVESRPPLGYKCDFVQHL